MTLFSFVIAIVLLLILPGPTNAILALSAEGLTPWGAVGKIASVLAAYVAVVLPVCLLAGPYFSAHPVMLQAVKLLAAAWVFFLALTLWRRSEAGAAPAPGTASLFTTTLLNPKGPIIGLTLMPQLSDAQLAVRLALFLAIAAASSALWLGFGRLALAGRRQKTVGRCGSALLACFGVALTASAF